MRCAAHFWWCVLLVAGIAGMEAPEARAGQLGALVSPGSLAKAHAAFEGVRNCATCHEAGRRVTVARCLGCHKPIAERIARKVGVHRAAGNDCVACHVEHAGRDAELRRMNVTTFNHSADTGFPLDGKHGPIARDCAMCHTQRTYLAARPACATCHTDVHKRSLGTTCTACHSTTVAFKDADTVFDHNKARFPLTGAHKPVACVGCHTTAGQFTPLRFDTCAACHMSPHRTTLGPSCTTCHTTNTWTTATVAHDRTRFPLVGSHVKVSCEKCHVSGDMAKPVRFEQCSQCHVNVHRESIKDDCRTCHTETSFHVAGPTGPAARFDHSARTGYALEGKHAAATCRQCHKSLSDATVPLARKAVDYSGARTECVSCHTDEHKGEYGVRCQACHRTTTTFDVKGFTHLRHPEFFDGEHGAVKCVSCHVPEGVLRPSRVGAAIVSFSPSSPPTECRSCHSDIHLGQLASTCETCHGVKGSRFAAIAFSHERTTLPLTGRHREIACVKCHASETARFPARTGTATRYAPVATTCRACHADPHLGQVNGNCETCHSTTTFTLTTYTHDGLSDLFGGFHGKLACQACHTRETGLFPAGRGTAVRYRVGRTCAACHQGF
jgi:hypothetical protein